MAHRSTGNTPMVRPCLVTLRDSLWKMQRSFDSLCSLPSTALRAGRMTMGSAALTTSSSSDGQKSAGGLSPDANVV